MRLVYIALGWAAGVVLAANNTSGSPLLPYIWLILVVLALLTVWLWWQDNTQRWVGLVLVALTLGGLRMSFYPVTSDVARYNNVGGLTIEGIVIAEPDVRDEHVQLRVAAETVTRIGQTVVTEGIVLVQAPRVSQPRYGDRIRATGLLSTPAEYDTFSYAGFLGRMGVFSIMRSAAVEVVAREQGNPLYARLLDVKAQAQHAINRHVPEPQAALLSGILLGYERGISPEVGNAFSAVSASHVIAISGFNMVILSGVVLKLLESVRASPRVSVMVAITVIAVYTIFVGANAAVVRAAVMSSVLIIGQAIKRRTYVPASLGFVAVVMSVINPTVLWDISFQLSFFATMGLALYVDPMSGWLNRQLARLFPDRIATAAGRFLSEPLLVTLAAQITTMPLIILYFGRFSPLSLVVNLLIVPPQAALLLLGALATMVAFISPVVAQLLYWMDYLLLGWTISVVRFFAGLPFADLELRVDPRLITLYFAFLIGAAMLQATRPAWAIRLARFIRRRAIVNAVVFGGALITLLLVGILLSRPDGKLHVWLLDVGHSNAVLVQTPGGAHILVDGGRFPSRLLTAIGDRLPFYDREIEVLVITQPDFFDYGALPAVLERYNIGVALTNGQTNLSNTFMELQNALAGHEVLAVRAGYTLMLDDGVLLEVLHPQRLPEPGSNMDANTLTLRISYGEASFLLTSDLSRAGQTELLAGGNWPVATVMQMPQHGGQRSLDMDFLAAVQPQVVIVQSDVANQRGDPEPDTLALVEGIPLFRTDQGGTIHLWTDGQTLWVRQG